MKQYKDLGKKEIVLLGVLGYSFLSLLTIYNFIMVEYELSSTLFNFHYFFMLISIVLLKGNSTQMRWALLINLNLIYLLFLLYFTNDQGTRLASYCFIHGILLWFFSYWWKSFKL